MKKHLSLLPLTILSLPIIITSCNKSEEDTYINVGSASYEKNMYFKPREAKIFYSPLDIQNFYLEKTTNNIKVIKNDYLYQIRQKYDTDLPSYDHMEWKYKLEDFSFSTEGNNCFLSCKYYQYRKYKLNDKETIYKLTSTITNQPIVFVPNYNSSTRTYDFGFNFDSTKNNDWKISSKVEGAGFTKYKDQTLEFDKDHLPTSESDEEYKLIWENSKLEYGAIYYFKECTYNDQ